MQLLTAEPRSALTQADVVRLIQDAPATVISAGCELVDMDLNVLEDITDDLADGTVSRQAYATLHGTCQLHISRELNWPNALVRPYMNISDSATTARFNLGVYLVASPRLPAGEIPVTFDIAGYDILEVLDTPVGEAYAVDTGTDYLSTVETILIAQGFTSYVIDKSSAGVVLPSPRVWPLDDHTTWLNVINDLLAAIGYQGIYSDWDGLLRIHAYENPRDRPAEWVYDKGTYTSMMHPERSRNRDFFKTPNKWVAIRNNQMDGPTPIEGDGMYTYVNQFDGDTSVSARGRPITRVMYFDAADQSSLVSQASLSIAADMRLTTTIEVSTHPNPLHWHFDRLLVDDPDLGGVFDVVGTQWSLPLNGEPMTQQWSVL